MTHTTDHLNAALAGRYEVLQEIGRGGMATVYLAHDLRHERKVAFKVLSPDIGAVVGVERFLAEIRVTANLQHPNLLPLFDSGQVDGTLFYVMPFVEGQSLRARLQREKQLPIPEAIHIATAVAGALHYAHRHNVIHRDLKPENILLQEGQPLVADFGIALAVSNAGGSRITQTGLSLGTPQYMSPEQATGDRELDARSDVYSLGAVTYEMLTGEPPHTGPTAHAVIAKVLTDRPRSIRLSRETVPTDIEAAVERALAKLPADRWASANDFATALHGKGAAVPSEIITPGSLRAPPGNRLQRVARAFRRMPVTPLAIAAMAVAALSAAAGYHWRSRVAASAPRDPVAFVLTPTANEEINWSSINVSMDGRRIVYPGFDGRVTRLYVRDLSEPAARVLPGTENGDSPFFSPDGEWIAFFSGGDLKRVPVRGGTPLPIVSGIGGAFTNTAGYQRGRQSAWLKDGRIVVPTMAVTGKRSGITVLEANQPPRALFVSDTARLENLQIPVVLPDGRTLAFRSDGPGGAEDDRLALGDLRTGEYTVFDLNAFIILGYLEGHLISVTGDPVSGLESMGTLVAVPVDLKDRRKLGDPTTLMDSLGAYARLSHSGTLIYATGRPENQLVLVGESGTDTLSTANVHTDPQLSPDGRRIALTLPGNPLSSVWVYNRADRSLTGVSGANGGSAPQWTPDGRHILYIKPSTAAAGIWQRAADGSGEEVRLNVRWPATAGTALTATMSPDGKTVMFVSFVGAQRRNIYYFHPAEDDSARAWRTTEFDEMAPRFSPDGRWVAYSSDESGRMEVYVRRFPDAGSRVQISLQGGVEPQWSRDGRRLYYRNGDQVMVAELAAPNTPQVVRRRDAFAITAAQTAGAPSYDVTADGQRLLYAHPVSGVRRIVVIVNWGSQVRERLRAARR